MSKVESGHWAKALEDNVDAMTREIQSLTAKIRELEAENNELYEELQVLKRMVVENG